MPSGIFLSILLFIGLNINVQGFGKVGHEVISNIAEAHLYPGTKNHLKNLIGRKTTLAEVSNWADDIKGKNPLSKSWHYVNINIEDSAVSFEKYWTSVNIISVLQNEIKLLGNVNATPKQKAESLKWIVHLMADLHQPLHVGDQNDMGGNKTTIFYDGKFTNLHAMWDSELIDHHFANGKILQHEIMKQLEYEEELDQFTKGNIEDWILESQKLARQCYVVEMITIDAGDTIFMPPSYGTKSLIQIKGQVKKAALRLAKVLNDIFAEEANFYSFKYSWSINSKMFHKASCGNISKIKPENLWVSDIPPYNKIPHTKCLANFHMPGYELKAEKKLSENDN